MLKHHNIKMCLLQSISKEPLAEGAAEGAGGAEETDRVEGSHHDHDDADLRERRGPAGENQRPHGVNGPRHGI